MTTKIELYNRALSGFIGTQGLHDTDGLTENVVSRYEMDRVYAPSLKYMLRQGLWKWSIRTVEMSYDPDFVSNFGWQYKFPQPSDYVRLAGISINGDFRPGTEPDYGDENNSWYANVDTLYLKYVSSGDTYGLDLGRYTEDYCEALAAWMAYKSVLPVSKDRKDRNDILQQHKMSLARAQTLDAVNEPVKFKPTGSLVQARAGWRSSLRNPSFAPTRLSGTYSPPGPVTWDND